MNFKGEKYPLDLLQLINDFSNIVIKIDRELKEGVPVKYYVSNFLHHAGHFKLNRKKLRSTYGCNSTHKDFGENEIKGIYLFAEEERPVYVGISQTIIRRLYQHIYGTKHNEAVFAFNMAVHNYNLTKKKYIGRREDFDFNERSVFQNLIKKMRLIIIPVNNNFELHMLEPYLACHYRCKWNTFETH